MLAETQLAISKLADAAEQAGLRKPSQARSERLAEEIAVTGHVPSRADG